MKLGMKKTANDPGSSGSCSVTMVQERVRDDKVIMSSYKSFDLLCPSPVLDSAWHHIHDDGQTRREARKRNPEKYVFNKE